jgi:hypothetical protein
MTAIVFALSMRPHIACNTYHQAGRVRKDSVMPMPTIGVINVGLRSCLDRDNGGPDLRTHCGFKQRDLNGLPARMQPPDVEQGHDYRPDQQLECQAGRQRGDVAANPIEP